MIMTIDKAFFYYCAVVFSLASAKYWVLVCGWRGTVASVPAAGSSSNSTVYTLHIQTLLHTTH